MVIEVSWLLEKVLLPIDVTELGIMTEVSWFSLKAPKPIVVTPNPPIVLSIFTSRGQAGLAELLPSWL